LFGNIDKNRIFEIFSTIYLGTWCSSSISILSGNTKSSNIELNFQTFSSFSQVDMITQQAMKAGFTGGLVVDYPNSTRAKKYVIINEL